MIILKITLIVVGFIISSLWLAILIGAGVEMELKNYFKNLQKEEDK